MNKVYLEWLFFASEILFMYLYIEITSLAIYLETLGNFICIQRRYFFLIISLLLSVSLVVFENGRSIKSGQKPYYICHSRNNLYSLIANFKYCVSTEDSGDLREWICTELPPPPNWSKTRNLNWNPSRLCWRRNDS